MTVFELIIVTAVVIAFIAFWIKKNIIDWKISNKIDLTIRDEKDNSDKKDNKGVVDDEQKNKGKPMDLVKEQTVSPKEISLVHSHSYPDLPEEVKTDNDNLEKEKTDNEGVVEVKIHPIKGQRISAKRALLTFSYADVDSTYQKILKSLRRRLSLKYYAIGKEFHRDNVTPHYHVYIVAPEAAEGGKLKRFDSWTSLLEI